MAAIDRLARRAVVQPVRVPGATVVSPAAAARPAPFPPVRRVRAHPGGMSVREPDDVVVDPEDVAHEIFVYDAETVRRDAERIGGRPAPSPLTYVPELTDFTD